MAKMCEAMGHEPIRREEKSYGGELLAVFCGVCQNPISLICPCCKRESVDIRRHFKEWRECWKKSDPQAERDYARTHVVKV